MSNKESYNVDQETFDELLGRVLPSRDRLIIPDAYKEALSRAARNVDLTPLLERKKGNRISYTTVYVSGAYFGFAGTGTLTTGIAFVKLGRKGIRRHRNGSPRWFFGDSNTLNEAAAVARKRYSIIVKGKSRKLDLPVSGWKKYKVRAYNMTSTEEIVINLKNLING